MSDGLDSLALRCIAAEAEVKRLYAALLAITHDHANAADLAWNATNPDYAVRVSTSVSPKDEP